MESLAVALTSAWMGCTQGKPLLPTQAHAGSLKLLRSRHQAGTDGLKSGQKVSCLGPHPLLLRAVVLAIRGVKGFSKQHGPVLKVTSRAAPAQLTH